jgi:DNA polymerase III subunit epsilon
MGMLDRMKAAASVRASDAAEAARGRAAERAKRSMPGITGLDLQFAVVDIETTGLDPRVDHIVEIGVLIANTRGDVMDELCTLVRPLDGFEMARAAQRVNLIDPEWLKAAPPLEVVLPQVAHRIHGRYIVAHNARFDTEFLEEGFRRSFGWSYDDLGDWTSVCTLELCRDVGLPRRLDAVCGELGIRYEKHSALGDCRATYKVLSTFLDKIDRRTFEGRRPTTLSIVPDLNHAYRPVLRGQAQEATTARPVLGRVMDVLPPHDGTKDRDPEAVDAYLLALEDAIADGYISAEEVNQLMAVASRYELSGDELRDLHQELVMGMIYRALEDNRISKAERDEIERVAMWLGVDTSDWTALVKAARMEIKAQVAEFRDGISGKAVAFTGSGIHKPNVREAFAAKHGFAYSTAVSADTDLLVIGTAQTETQQVEEARAAGIPILVETTFWRQLGEV